MQQNYFMFAVCNMLTVDLKSAITRFHLIKEINVLKGLFHEMNNFFECLKNQISTFWADCF